MKKLKMNPFHRGVVAGMVLMVVMDVLIVAYYPKKINEQNTKYTSTTTTPGPNRETNSTCEVDVVYNLTTSGLKKIQNERKSRIRDVCEKCRSHRSWMECNHVALDKDKHNNIMYENLIVDDVHKVGGSF